MNESLFKYNIDENVDFQKFKFMYDRQSSPTPAKRTDGYYATCHPAVKQFESSFKEPSVFPLGDIHVIHVFIYLFVDWSQLDDLHENEYKSY